VGKLEKVKENGGFYVLFRVLELSLVFLGSD
jgi:hypothetical protein